MKSIKLKEKNGIYTLLFLILVTKIYSQENRKMILIDLAGNPIEEIFVLNQQNNLFISKSDEHGNFLIPAEIRNVKLKGLVISDTVVAIVDDTIRIPSGIRLKSVTIKSTNFNASRYLEKLLRKNRNLSKSCDSLLFYKFSYFAEVDGCAKDKRRGSFTVNFPNYKKMGNYTKINYCDIYYDTSNTSYGLGKFNNLNYSLKGLIFKEPLNNSSSISLKNGGNLWHKSISYNFEEGKKIFHIIYVSEDLQVREQFYSFDISDKLQSVTFVQEASNSGDLKIKSEYKKYSYSVNDGRIYLNDAQISIIDLDVKTMLNLNFIDYKKIPCNNGRMSFGTLDEEIKYNLHSVED
jgi:hypothetical protein